MVSKHYFLEILSRLDATRINILNPYDIPITLFARADVPIEAAAITQLLKIVDIQATLEVLAQSDTNFWGSEIGKIARIVLTPDFHKGAGIPVGTVIDTQGFVIPQAIGNDICCGMRLLVTDMTATELATHQPALTKALRAIFFQGKRELPFSPRQREALLTNGLWGLHETYADNGNKGLWQYYDPTQQAEELRQVHFQGVLPTSSTTGFADFIRSADTIESYDSQIGSIGGGNHFVELQVVQELYEGAMAYQWGIHREQIAIMVHSGSVGLGHLVGSHFRDLARNLYPKHLPHPANGFYVLPTEGPHAHLAASYLAAMRNAANFAFGNRLFLGLMVVRACSEVLKRRVTARLIYDAPHNLIWPEDQEHYLHRKGACPALGPDPLLAPPFAYRGDPVIIPGSMGDASYLLVGQGNQEALMSACHGAGRSLARGEARKVDKDTYEQAMSKLQIITPIDPLTPEISLRRDILAKYQERLQEEAPYAYKPITPIIQTIEEAGIAQRVARLWPLMTIKG